MELEEAQNIILKAVENPAAYVSTKELAIAIATVLVRNELLGASPQTVTLTFLAQEAG